MILRDERVNCPNCRLGRLHLKARAYIAQYGETLISVPNMPVWICDVCRYQHFDSETIRRVELLVGQSMLPPNRYRPAPRPKVSPPERAGSPEVKAPPKAKR